MAYQNVLTDGDGVHVNAVSTFEKQTHVHDERMQAYDLAYPKTQTGQTFRVKQSPAVGGRGEGSHMVSPSDQGKRDAIRRLLARSRETARCLAEATDPIERASAGFSLGDHLASLWEMRDVREDDWGDVLNVLQTVFLNEVLEDISDAKATALCEILKYVLSGPPVQSDDAERALTILRQGGFDPWVGISQQDGP